MKRSFVYAIEAQKELADIVRYCVVRPGQLPLVLAVLHERMDLMVRLKGRLG